MELVKFSFSDINFSLPKIFLSVILDIKDVVSIFSLVFKDKNNQYEISVLSETLEDESEENDENEEEVNEESSSEVKNENSEESSNSSSIEPQIVLLKIIKNRNSSEPKEEFLNFEYDHFWEEITKVNFKKSSRKLSPFVFVNLENDFSVKKSKSEIKFSDKNFTIKTNKKNYEQYLSKDNEVSLDEKNYDLIRILI